MKKIYLIAALLLVFTLSVMSQTYSINENQTISITGGSYINNMSVTWNITSSVANKPLSVNYSIDTESKFDYVTIYGIDSSGNLIKLNEISGAQSGTISTLFPTGKAKITFTSDGSVSNYDGASFLGINISLSVDNTTSVSTNPYAIGNSVLFGNLGIGTLTPSTNLDIVGDVRIKTTNKNQALSLYSDNSSGAPYGLYNSVNSSSASPTNGIYSSCRNSNSSAATVYGLYNYSYSANSSSGNLYGIYSYVSGGKNRWSGYFYGGDLEVKNGNIKTSGYLYGGNILTFMDNARFTVTSTQIPTLTISSFSMPQYGIGTPNASGSAETWISGNAGIRMFTAGNVIPRLSILNSGNVGIGTITPDALLTVNGTIHAKEVKVDLTGSLADYVFSPDYKLMPLSHVESFVKTNSHLPDMPSAEEVEENGLNMGEMQNKLLQKVEELTLYAIQQQKQIIELQKQVDELKSRK